MKATSEKHLLKTRPVFLTVILMVKIDDLLEPDEKVLKRQHGINAGRGIMAPLGTLYLTNKRVIFIPNKLLTLMFSDIYTGMNTLLKKGLHVIPLNEIKNVKSSFGAVVIEADKKYTYTVTVWKTKGWVNAINQAIAEMTTKPKKATSTPKIKPKTKRSTTKRTRKTKTTTKPTRTTKTEETIEFHYCPNCGTKLKPTYKYCPNCGYKLH